jgi:cell fate regulator YaaT (PSP1 superfamily)
MPTVVGVSLRHAASPVLVDTEGLDLSPDSIVLVITDRGEEPGRVIDVPHELGEGESADSSVRMERQATREDLERAAELHAKEREAMPVYRRLANKHKLDMKPTDVEFLFDGSRAVFYFVAEDRVDFRDLVRDLAAEFHTRVDMRQIGVRDEARLIGGLGHCGEQLCCVRFGGEFQPVSIRMAKEQDLPLNPLKISGQCGRLMCCLRYEYDAYKDFKGRAPKKGAIVQVGELQAKVVELDTPRERVTMRKEDGSRVTFGLDEMECGCGGKGGHGAGCPCAVKAEAIERHLEAASAGFAASAPGGAPGRERTLTESTAPREAAAPAPSETPPAKRRRRRRGGGGGEEAAAAAPQQPKQAKEPKKAKEPRRSGASKPAAPAPEAATAPASRRRRRRRRGGGGTEAAPTTDA